MEVCVIGAGEAGREAAREATLGGASVAIVDARESPLPDWRAWPGLIEGDVQGRSDRGRGALDGDPSFGTKVVSVSRGSALSAGGRRFAADSFIVATGAEFEPIALEGRRKTGVSVLDSPGSYADLGRTSISARSPVVTGEGWRGMEVAEKLAHRGTRVAQFFSIWQGRGPGGPALRALTAAAADAGVSVAPGPASRALGLGRVEAVLCGGTVFPADLLAVVPRRRPRPVQCPVDTDAGGAVIVGSDMRTSCPGILAAGGCAAVRMGSPSVRPLLHEQAASGRVAGASSTGGTARLSAPRHYRSAVFGIRWTAVRLGSHGRASGYGSDSVHEEWGDRTSCSIDFDPRSGSVLGLELVEDMRRPERLLTIFAERPTLRSLAYGGSTDSSDISLISDTARKGLRSWSRY